MSDAPPTVFHVEARQFPNSARKFNLTREQLDARIVAPWLAGRSIELDDRRFSPERAKLTIIEGPPLRSDEIGMGRGWANAGRAGHDATKRILSEVPVTARPSGFDAAAVEQFKGALIFAATSAELTFGRIIEMAAQVHPSARVSERVGLAERAVWELLHQGRIGLLVAGEQEPVPAARWEPVMLAWESWRAGTPRPAILTVENPRGSEG